MAGRARTSVAALVLALALRAAAAAQGTGILLFTDKEQIPLKVYAEFMPAGVLRFTSGAVKDIPTIDTFRMLRTSLTGWAPVAVMVASEDLFKSEYSERRMIPIATRPVGVTALAVRVADLEQPDRIRELHAAIQRPEGGDDAYFFLILTSGGINRYYPFRIRQGER
jgi:hypothetical protein